MTDTAAAPTPDRAFFGHPRGLGFLALSEAWERFSYYGMQTLLVLYMSRQLLLPGHVEHIAGFSVFRGVLDRTYGKPLSVVALASVIFGLYAGLVYLTPILGGMLADRWLGLTRTITIGALLMACGHFLMAFDASFLLALACLIVGVGCFKGNLATQVGNLYAAGDLRRADAFQIYYIFINVGVIVSPLIVGTLGELYGWHYGFAAAGIGMLLALGIYLSGRRWLPSDRRAQPPPEPSLDQEPLRLQRSERSALIVLLLLLPVLAVGAVGNQQVFNAYLLWAPQHIDMVLFGHTMPTSWLITVDASLSLAALVGVLGFWRLWALRFTEPNEVAKITLGLFISAGGVSMLVIASLLSANGDKANIGWALAFHAINSIGYANIFPVGLALYARAAPKALAGTLIGIYYAHLFLANNLVGCLGTLSERLSGLQFWLLHAAMIIGAGVTFFIVTRIFIEQLAPRGDPVPPDRQPAPGLSR